MGKIKKLVGKVTEEERDEVQNLFERKNGLKELTRSLLSIDKKELDESALYEKLVADMGAVSIKFQNWWDEKSAHYNWESSPNGNWEINFDSCEIFLVS